MLHILGRIKSGYFRPIYFGLFSAPTIKAENSTWLKLLSVRGALTYQGSVLRIGNCAYIRKS